MHAYLVLGFSAFVCCLVLTPLFRNFFLRLGLVDRPDAHRKLHVRAVPRMGGLPIALSYLFALLVAFCLNPHYAQFYLRHEQLLHALVPAAAIIFTTGLLDDLYGLKPWQKLLGQLIAANVAVLLGPHIAVAHTPVWLADGLAVMWLIGCSNAVNLIDGMDGLATGVGLLATLTTVIVASITGNSQLALASIPLAGGLLGFLRYNFSPATIFLGDCGSLTIGFVLGCFGLIWGQHSSSPLGMAAPLMALALPLIDVCLAIGRRFLRNVPIFSADRGHIHHKILGLGFSTRDAALILYAVCGLFASLAVLESFSKWNSGWIFVVLFVALTLFGIKRLGYIEFEAVRKTLSQRRMRRDVRDEIYLHELSHALQQADSVEAWWDVVRDSCRELQFASARLELGESSFVGHELETSDRPVYHIQINFGEHGLLMLTRLREDAPPRVMMAALHRVQLSFESLTHSEAEPAKFLPANTPLDHHSVHTTAA